MKPKPYEAQNTKFSEYERSLLISYATFELLKFENRTEVIIEISRFSRHRRPGINEGVFACLQWCPIKVRDFHQNESCPSCPHPPSSYEERREQGRQLSF